MSEENVKKISGLPEKVNLEDSDHIAGISNGSTVKFLGSAFQLKELINLTDTRTIFANSYLSLDGDKDYMTVPDDPSLNIPNDVTWSAWIRWSITPSTGNNYATIMDKSNSNWQSDIRLSHSNNNSSFEWGIQEKHILAVTEPQSNLWYHVVGTYDGSVIKLYINGIEEANKDVSDSIEITINDLHIGCEADTQNREFTGDITDIRIYNTALIDTQVAALYNNGINSTGEILDSGGNLVSRWDFSEQNYTDSEGSNDGTPNGDIFIDADEAITEEDLLSIEYDAQNNKLNFGSCDYGKDMLYHFRCGTKGSAIKTGTYITGEGTESQTLIQSEIENAPFLFGFQKDFCSIYSGYRWRYNQIDFVAHSFDKPASHKIATNKANNIEYHLGHGIREDTINEKTRWHIRAEGGIDGEHDLVIGNFAGLNVGDWNNEYLRINQSTGNVTIGAITQKPLSSEPEDPVDGHSVQWVSDGNGTIGDVGDVCIKINVGGNIKNTILVDYSNL